MYVSLSSPSITPALSVVIELGITPHSCPLGGSICPRHPKQKLMFTYPAATKAFSTTFVSAQEFTTTAQGAGLRAHIEYKEAYARLSEFDVLIIPGYVNCLPQYCLYGGWSCCKSLCGFTEQLQSS